MTACASPTCTRASSGARTPNRPASHDQLINRFDYDGDYGTVLNRFLIQAAIDYPLTVHGTGGQTRAFIHIQDSVRCIELALNNPPAAGDKVKIFNQMTETHRVRDLAEMIARMTGAKVAYLPNPRKEAAENDLIVKNEQFLANSASTRSRLKKVCSTRWSRWRRNSPTASTAAAFLLSRPGPRTSPRRSRPTRKANASKASADPRLQQLRMPELQRLQQECGLHVGDAAIPGHGERVG